MQVRLNRDGPKPYYTPTHTARSVAAMHDHSDLIRTCGMGEFAAVLNGIDFRTRHNDYQLVMAVTNSTRYHATEDIPFPEVPPDVLQYLELNEQVRIQPKSCTTKNQILNLLTN